MLAMQPGLMGAPKKDEPKKSKVIPKLIANERNSRVIKSINHCYKLFFIVRRFTGKLLWFGSCVVILYLLPLNLLLFKDQEIILQKISMQSGAGLGAPEPTTMRPY